VTDPGKQVPDLTSAAISSLTDSYNCWRERNQYCEAGGQLARIRTCILAEPSTQLIRRVCMFVTNRRRIQNPWLCKHQPLAPNSRSSALIVMQLASFSTVRKAPRLRRRSSAGIAAFPAVRLETSVTFLAQIDRISSTSDQVSKIVGQRLRHRDTELHIDGLNEAQILARNFLVAPKSWLRGR
jgi:hypothetical protein